MIINELGFVSLSPTGAELLFEVFSQHCKRGSILVTTNLPVVAGEIVEEQDGLGVPGVPS